MKWVLSDGTVVHLGGKVEGDSTLALLLREEHAAAADGWGPRIDAGPPPRKSIPVDFDNPWHVFWWISDSARCLGATFVERPDLPHVTSELEPYVQRDGVLN